jgi:hypothetical protein
LLLVGVVEAVILAVAVGVGVFFLEQRHYLELTQ